jgi:Protein of unknown function (DUF1353)
MPKVIKVNLMTNLQPTRALGFESPYPVAVSQVGPIEWELSHAMTYHGRDETFVVPAGQKTDFASVPRVLTWLVPTTTGIAAAVLHDYLWREHAPQGLISYRDADGVLRQALGTLGVPILRRWLMWAAVRWGALLTRPGGWREWHRDAPAVLAVSVVALPIVAVPVITTLPFLALYALFERLIAHREK